MIFFKQQNRSDSIEEYALKPFEVQVQSIERTFIDKIFAIGDCYLDDKITEHSRHIYDLSMLWKQITVNDEMKSLFRQVREDRKTHRACLSAQDGVDLALLLKEIAEKDVYKNDYETITASLLFEKVPYETAINAVNEIIESGLF